MAIAQVRKLKHREVSNLHQVTQLVNSRAELEHRTV